MRWIKEQDKTLLKSKILEVLVRRSHSEDGAKTHDFFIMRSGDWANIIPVTEDGKVVMVKQYRVGIEDFTLEVPGGVIDANDASAQSGAIREMTEETGYVALPGAHCQSLGWTLTNPAILNNRCHSFVIGPVQRQRNQRLDPGEMIETVEIPLKEIPSRILAGEITHALMLNTFFLLSLQGNSGKGALLDELRTFTGCK